MPVLYSHVVARCRVLMDAEALGQQESVKEASGANILMVLGGNVGVEMAVKAAEHELTVPFTPGRTDASQDMTEIDTHACLEPRHIIRAVKLSGRPLGLTWSTALTRNCVPLQRSTLPMAERYSAVLS
ncbi:Catalase / Peroxidase [Halomonas citrativorans]|uniref:Catalase / Peroxidase n=1 Tax=Halomonas citrativorans TaxID=2742612 RepID=A0A1R4I625_9GAMM|nr:hypothetical protein [Halomonas citrativorans]SJN15044.1 Catalase / Peroxidase [Halomonas citrativorans]